MASPRVLVQIILTGTKILGKAFLEAGRQAVKNAKHRPQGAIVGGDVAGVANANTGSMTDQLTRQHRMTLDEAHLILNVKRGEEMEKVLSNYEHLFKANSPPPPPEKPVTGAKAKSQPSHSHYLQSKVVRARERVEAELQIANEKPAQATNPSESQSTSTNGPGGGSS
ncbi:mitochondrial import inner membrane translocase subunit tim16 [Moniliophthora roreri MCA 2997]|uniref:Mitochondrial import inner membrane translocase subunit TIM16 n=1 Tax=Moniliophthora roreri (strain MCA 2997) TaxID=1381753 RepID=V2X6N9_MONRO|nr:mitochondrial import inner membrane translocase subunit tim16 [Moniliophthora roreri MCA 2997]KAI3619673.1 mitochondrial import inner membrane translocase subunit tim16 [Moniliophthora roreri]